MTLKLFLKRMGICEPGSLLKKEQLKGIIDTENLTDSVFKVIISPITQAEADEIEFKSLKGIADRPLDRDEVRKERLGL